MSTRQRVYVSLGSNVEREHNLRSAVQALTARFGKIARSPVYANPAVGFIGDDFYNLVVGFDTDLPLAELLAELREIERQHGRLRGEAKFAPRTLDLDVLTYGTLVTDGPPLKLPRADILEYDFVLRPLADLAGTERHPREQMTFAELWRGFAPKSSALTLVSDVCV